MPTVFLMGPTAAGKTALALRLAAELPFEIVSVDSVMVYRGMDIGTGKPSREVLERVAHRLVDIRDPVEPYSAAEFAKDARRAITEIRRTGRWPLLVGGTGLYFRALESGLSPLPAADSSVRARLAEQAGRFGWAALHARLAEVDPLAAERIHPNDPQRIQRALEVYELAGVPMSRLQEAHCRANIGDDSIVRIVLEPADRGLLHGIIAERFRVMLREGLVDEVRRLRERREVHRDLPAIRAVGYRQVWDYLEGATGHDAMTQRAIAATRQLARRQLTWLRAEARAIRFDSFSATLVEDLRAVLER